MARNTKLGARGNRLDERAFAFLASLVLVATVVGGASIDRAAVVARHDPRRALGGGAAALDPCFVLPLGNGALAFVVDASGLQSLNATTAPCLGANTMADWGWHTAPPAATGAAPAGAPPTAALSRYNMTRYSTPTDGNGGTRDIDYPTGGNNTDAGAAGAWTHANPHRANLVQVALAWAGGGAGGAGGSSPLAADDIVSGAQALSAWSGVADTNLTLARGAQRAAVRVRATVHPDVDAFSVSVSIGAYSSTSAPAPAPPLLLRLAFPYAVGGESDWSRDALHSTDVTRQSPGAATIERTLDGDGYRLDCAFDAAWTLARDGAFAHVLLLSPPQSGGAATAATDLTCLLAPRGVRFPVGAATPWLLGKRAATLALQAAAGGLPGFDAVAAASAAAWAAFFGAGAFVDLAGRTGDPAAFELERRVVRSLALLRALEAGAEPPAEPALLYAGEWSGKHHGEMRFWHQTWAAHWGRPEVLARSDAFYADYLMNASSVAAAQGFRGARWPKMTAAGANRSAGGIDVPWTGLDFAPLPSAVNGGDLAGLAPLLAWESSSGIGPLLLWQQPHSITLAESQRRAAAAAGGAPAALDVMQRLAPVVFATADFLASFPYLNASDGRLHLGPPMYGGEENGADPLAVADPAFELVQARAALDTAAAWRAALGLPPVAAWGAVADGLAAPPLDPATRGGARPVPLYANNAACACAYEPQGSPPCAFANAGCPSAHTLQSHPMTAGLVGMLNGLGRAVYGVDVESANATVAEVVANWTWGDANSSPTVWGWDSPLVTLSLARLNWAPEAAVAMLLRDFEKNAYNAVGLNTGMGASSAYLPGNGGTLLAVAALAAGFDVGAPGEALARGGPGAAPRAAPGIGFPRAWGAITEGFEGLALQ